MRLETKNSLRLGSVIFLFLVIFGYAYYKTKDLIGGVSLKVNNLTDGESFNQPLVNIEGQAKNARVFSINDRIVSVDRQGLFADSLLLEPGYNIISFKAEDKFGQKTQINYQLTAYSF